MSVAIVVAGGEPPDVSLAARLPQADMVIAADSGLDHALTLGLEPTMLVGDLDSISPAGLRWAKDNGIPIESHPVDKDVTDLELALSIAAGLAQEVVVVDGSVGRFDHALGNALLLGSSRWQAVNLSAVLDTALITVVRKERQVSGAEGDLISLFAVGGPAQGVTTRGLRWPLTDSVLEPGASLGTSNELLGATATIAVSTGVVLAIQEA